VKLSELEPQFLRYTATDYVYVNTLAQAQGIKFLCPKCFERNGGAVGTHIVVVWFNGRDVDAIAVPTPRWGVSGTGYTDLTIVPSISLERADLVGCQWHGFVKNGDAS
jgi:hypothetical protein